MNIYLFSALEIVIYCSIAYFIGRSIDFFDLDQKVVNLNYIFWGVFIILSILANFQLYLYFGSAFIVGILVLFIYIFKEVKVEFFVEQNMTLYFWILFGIFMLTIVLLVVTKRMLLSAYKSEPPRGDTGVKGDTGNRGESYFIESASDQIYVHIVLEIEKYFTDILDKNGVPYDKNEFQFNNIYLKDAIRRIAHSPQLMCRIMGTHDDSEYECGFDDNYAEYDTNRIVGTTPIITEIVNNTTPILDRRCRVKSSDYQNMYTQTNSDSARTNPRCLDDRGCGNMGYQTLDGFDVKNNQHITAIVDEV